MDYKTTTIAKKVGSCGNIYCLFLEDEDAFHKVQIKGDIGKMPCGGAWLEGMARILTYSLRRGLWEGSAYSGIVKQLKGIRCNSLVPNEEKICSCADAIGKALDDYLKIQEKEEAKV